MFRSIEFCLFDDLKLCLWLISEFVCFFDFSALLWLMFVFVKWCMCSSFVLLMEMLLFPVLFDRLKINDVRTVRLVFSRIRLGKFNPF